ncbi:family 20 glycosylhydrolase [Flavihumibacter stibioxidans]|uniref:family 20 glycosylhydrolase n=1 Tax=Flavihumibacter stibioxidans TaxID=1834163 RepID=UPI00164F23C5|nr:family 20 glycosylhydrolase [Flavihumibacter stibioxidans]
MKRIAGLLLLTCLVTITNAPLLAQKSPAFSASDLAVEWSLVTNNYMGKSVALNELTLTNKGKKDFPASGWTIYFTSSREIFSNKGKGDIEFAHVNGDVFKMSPAAGFKGLKKGGRQTVQYETNGSSFNLTTAPGGLYLVWDARPDKGYALTNFSTGSFRDTTASYKTPADLFHQQAATKDLDAERYPKILPSPVSYKEGKGEFLIGKNTVIIAPAAFNREAAYLAAEIGKLTGTAIPVMTTGPFNRVPAISFQQKEMKEEAYQLEVKPDDIIISAGSGAGAFYGIQSMLSLMPPATWKAAQPTIAVPAVSVEDAPRFGFRSFMLDIARNFQTRKELMKFIDLMALYKLNTLHLHFSDDEGWRIEMPSFPELTQVGAQRGHPLDGKNNLPPSYGAGPTTGKHPASGFYSRQDFIEILRYATERHIQILPEVETPGHARAAIKAMDARYRRYMQEGNREAALQYLLRDTLDQSVYSTAQYWTDNVMCVALPSVYNFIEKVVDDIVGMYKEAGAPLTGIHMGGDEVPNGAWEKSPLCQELIAADPELEVTDDLWYYYYKKVAAILKARNLQLSGWEEVGMRKTREHGQYKLIANPRLANEGYRLHVWNNMVGWGVEDLPYRLANAGYQVVLSPVSNNYFDMAYHRSPEEPGYYWGGFTDVDKPFYFIPYDYFKNTKEDAAGNPIKPGAFVGKDLLSDFGKTNIVGLQGLIWAENIRSEERLEYMALPKLLGLAERAWAADPAWATEKDPTMAKTYYQHAWSVFANQLGKRELPRLDNYAGGFQYRIPPPGAVLEGGQVTLNTQFPGLQIRYTIDGSEPGAGSSLYNGPVQTKGTIRAKTFNTTGRGSRTVEIKNP